MSVQAEYWHYQAANHLMGQLPDNKADAQIVLNVLAELLARAPGRPPNVVPLTGVASA